MVRGVRGVRVSGSRWEADRRLTGGRGEDRSPGRGNIDIINPICAEIIAVTSVRVQPAQVLLFVCIQICQAECL